MELKNIKCSYHRNGIAGVGFHVTTFTCEDEGETLHLVGVLFPNGGECAVLNIDALMEDKIDFIQGYGYRGDIFEPELRNAIYKKDLSGA